jgi:hypothetical protein
MQAWVLCVARSAFSRRRHGGILPHGISPVQGAAPVVALCLSMGCTAGGMTDPTVVDGLGQERGGYRATDATVTATPENYVGACPQHIQARAQITTDGPAAVKYEWESDGGYTQPERLIVFDGAGTQEVETSLPVGASAAGWIRLRIALPNSLVSNEASYLVTCHGSG